MNYLFAGRIYIVVMLLQILSCGGGASSSTDTNTTTGPTTPGGGVETVFESFSVEIENTTGNPLVNVPVTIGQPFKKGHIKQGEFFKAAVVGSTNTAITSLQLDRKAIHVDGTLRHGIISFILPELAANETKTVLFEIDPDTTSQLPSSACDLNTISPTITADINITGDGVYSADAMDKINDADTSKWLDGSVVTEWIIKGDLEKSAVAHTDIEIYFHVRCYSTGDIKTDFVVENTIAHQEDKNFGISWTFDNQSGFDVQASEITHFARARFRKTIWSDDVPPINIKHDTVHIIHSKAVASYDQNGPPSETTLSRIKTNLDAGDTGPMGIGDIIANFRDNDEASMDASWSVAYLLSGDSRAYESMMAHANAAGSFAVHYRDSKDAGNANQSSGNHPSVLEYPEIGTNRNSDILFQTSTHSERDQIGSPDSAHQDSFAYMPYLLTGDYYLLEEVQFWANWNYLLRNPSYRNEFGDAYNGLQNRAQIRSQAWSLRELANAAFITPDSAPDKTYFMNLLENNLSFYVDKHMNGSHDNSLGYLVKLTVYHDPVTYGGNYLGWPDPSDPGEQVQSGVGPWQENWVGAVFGRIYHMHLFDNDEALELLRWKSRFVVGPLTDPGFCPIIVTAYNYHVTDANLDPYDDWADVYLTTLEFGGDVYEDFRDDLADCGSEEMSAEFGLPAGAFRYSHSENSYYARMQGAVAAAFDSGAVGSADAWDVFTSSTVTPDYTEGNRYNIVPYEN